MARSPIEGSIRRSIEGTHARVVEAAQRRLLGKGDARLEPAVAAFRAALILDIRSHRLAWSFIVAGAMAATMLWVSIGGLPLARPASFDLPVASPPAALGELSTGWRAR